MNSYPPCQLISQIFSVTNPKNIRSCHKTFQNTSTMTLHIHCSCWYQIVCPPYAVFLNFQKGCISGAVRSLLPDKPILGVVPGLPVLHLLCGISHRVYHGTVIRAEVLT